MQNNGSVRRCILYHYYVKI